MSLQVVLELKRPWQLTAIRVSAFFASLGRKGKRRGREEEGKGREGKGREGKGREGYWQAYFSRAGVTAMDFLPFFF